MSYLTYFVIIFINLFYNNYFFIFCLININLLYLHLAIIFILYFIKLNSYIKILSLFIK